MVVTNELVRELVLSGKVIDEAKLQKLEASAEGTYDLATLLAEHNAVTDEQLGALVAAHASLPFIVLSKLTIPEDVFRMIPERIMNKQKVVAFARDAESIKVATSNPDNTSLLKMISRKVGAKVMVYYATERDIDNTKQIYRKVLQKTIDELLRDDIRKATAQKLNEAPVAKIVDALIDAAYQDKASDIHIEPQDEDSLVRFRIDGVLHDVLRLPMALHDRIINRIKVLSSLRTDEHFSAQDGKLRMELADENLDMRVSIIPIVEGEKAVMRLLSSNSRAYTLADLGMNEKDLKKVTAAYGKSFGMILSTGPTGSGKTTSIYSMLKILNTREKNITTIEDPVEYRIQGANQIQTNAKTNLTFAAGLRAILRQDPNIIFVGEIRDGETAEIAVNAALTGHLVLSTLHTNDAATAIPRLIDMKVEPFLAASTVNIIIAQRLVRKICDICKAPYEMSREEVIKSIPEDVVDAHFPSGRKLTLYKGRGCKVCHQTGYSGRIGVFEVLEVSKEIRKLINTRADSDMIAKEAIREGMTLMLDDGVEKIKSGMTTFEEVIRVTKVESL